MNPSMSDLTAIAPLLLVAGTALVVVLVDALTKRNRTLGPVLTLAGLAAAMAFALPALGEAPASAAFGGMVRTGGFTSFFTLVFCVSGLLSVLLSISYIEAMVPEKGEYYALILFAVSGMILMAAAGDLVVFFLGLELMSLSFYILAGFARGRKTSNEAALKYFLLGAFATGFLLYGIALVYGATGSTALAGFPSRTGGLQQPLLLLAGLALLMIGLMFKVGAVPFHMWVPDVYEGAPITITAFLSVASKAGGFALMIRFFKVTFIDTAVASLPSGAWTILPGFDWRQIVVLLSVLTMTVGNLVAIWQNNLKRLLAYSSIAHAGYMLMGLVVLSNDGIAAVMLYFVIYLFMNLGAFYVVMLIANKTGSEDIEDYKGLGSRSPFLAVALAIFLISLTGLPPTAGFIGKLYLFAALVNHEWVWLAVVGALNSVVALYYYVRVLRNTFLRAGDKPGPALVTTRLEGALVLVLLVPTLLLGVYFTPLVDLAQASVKIFGTP